MTEARAFAHILLSLRDTKTVITTFDKMSSAYFIVDSATMADGDDSQATEKFGCIRAVEGF